MKKHSFAWLLLGSGAVLIVAACSGASSSDENNPSSSGGTPAADSGMSTTPGEDSSTSTTGDSSTTSGMDSSTPKDGSTGAFTLTSDVITEGGSFPDANTCTGADTSPKLIWANAPVAAKSFGIVLHDTTNNLLHASIYDIPASNTFLGAGLMSAYAPTTPAGAHETKNISNTFGYAGPCPPNEHVYEFVIYALDVAVLPGLSMTTTTIAASAAMQAHMIASTKLTAKYKKP